MSDKVLIIYTGGTIGMVQANGSDALVPFDFERISEKVPELHRFSFGVDTISFDPPIDSSDITVDVWAKLANLIEQNYHRYIGFVILHGTDTMSYTASALSFMLHNLSKPVVLTGSQLPLGLIRTDGKENLITALEIAGAQIDGKAIVPEVTIFFQSKLYRGNRTTKVNAENFNAFGSFNYPELAEAGVHIRYNHPVIFTQNMSMPFGISTCLDCHVAILTIFPGMTEAYVKSILAADGIKAVVLKTFGSGNAPSPRWFSEAVRDAVSRGVIVLNLTQCLAGSVDMTRYKTGEHLVASGVISGFDMTLEAALTKLMYLLGNCSSSAEIVTNLKQSLKGEMSV